MIFSFFGNLAKDVHGTASQAKQLFFHFVAGDALGWEKSEGFQIIASFARESLKIVSGTFLVVKVLIILLCPEITVITFGKNIDL